MESLKKEDIVKKLKSILEKKGYSIYPQEINQMLLLGKNEKGTFSFEVKRSGKFVLSGFGTVMRNHLYTNYSYLVIPKEIFTNLEQDVIYLVKQNKLGLILLNDVDWDVVSESEFKEPTKNLTVLREW
jgi:hypothetical protein